MYGIAIQGRIRENILDDGDRPVCNVKNECDRFAPEIVIVRYLVGNDVFTKRKGGIIEKGESVVVEHSIDAALPKIPFNGSIISGI